MVRKLKGKLFYSINSFCETLGRGKKRNKKTLCLPKSHKLAPGSDSSQTFTLKMIHQRLVLHMERHNTENERQFEFTDLIVCVILKVLGF